MFNIRIGARQYYVFDGVRNNEILSYNKNYIHKYNYNDNLMIIYIILT